MRASRFSQSRYLHLHPWNCFPHRYFPYYGPSQTGAPTPAEPPEGCSIQELDPRCRRRVTRGIPAAFGACGLHSPGRSLVFRLSMLRRADYPVSSVSSSIAADEVALKTSTLPRSG